MRFTALLSAVFLFPAALCAQERPNTILVMDGSGSMWGQIDGVNKIVIARDVVGEILKDFPAEENLGLTVYGHREKGNCADIETVVAPGLGTAGAIEQAVNGISPKGKTPMTDAVIAAAEALRFTEEAATVILVSDGIETCHPDPCAAARALEETGVDFTAHVVGFDVTDPAALAQMQCLAGETGGTFTTASNAAELTTALAAVTVEPEPVPVPQTVRIVAVLEPGGAEITDQINWSVRLGDKSAEGSGPGYALDLMAGQGAVRGTRVEDGVEATLDFTVASVTENNGLRVEVVFPEPEPETAEVTFTARIGTEDGPLITDPVLWSVTSDAGQASEDAPGNPYVAELTVGSHVVTAYWTAQEVSAERQFIATANPREIVIVFEEPRDTATITAPKTAVAGSTIEVSWNGPNEKHDYLGIGLADARGPDQWKNYEGTDKGNPLNLVVPMTPGAHVITYFKADGREPIGTAPIMVTPVTASLSAPETAVAGSTIEVAWEGPNYHNDYVGIGKVGAKGSGLWQNYFQTREGQVQDLQVPPEPGQYQITYFANQDRTPLTSMVIEVTDFAVSVTAPETAVAGSSIEVVWEGPDYHNDYIGIGKAGASGGMRWQNYTQTREGSPLTLLTPAEPGEYVITYFTNQDRMPAASTTITLTDVVASITAPASVEAGSTIEVAWTGPDYARDYIGIGKAGATGGARWETYTHTSEGAPLKIRVPAEAGEYEITYFTNQDRKALVSETLTVTEPAISVSAPASAAAGSTIEVAWTGPNYAGDYVGIGKVGATGGARWERYGSTKDGAVLDIQVPITPGAYEVTYFIGQGRTAKATVPLEVLAVEASVTAPASAVAGSTIEVAWDGPNYKNDYVGIGRDGATGSGQWETFAYTKDGAPANIKVPVEPGAYTVTYFASQDRTPLAVTRMTVTGVTAELTAPAKAAAGSEIEVGWTGPNYKDDYLGIGKADATGSGQWRNYAHTRNGNPVMLKMPDEPGTYMIRYFLNQDRKEIGSVSIVVE
ncbi:VWA domain-containing protein [Pacificoceanicola onchidii]|uniref:VWA domain-containing protein n=1 Tax=Pacificoceanicola onchidii TaxID=2562685 RepID=UPI001455ED0B|nr:VWA domain-containing protein [Pacificoceanicola onchidii]